MLIQDVLSTHRIENVKAIQGPYCLYKDKNAPIELTEIVKAVNRPSVR